MSQLLFVFATTVLAVFWSVPNYPAAMPSWYNLYLATGGTLALMLREVMGFSAREEAG